MGQFNILIGIFMVFSACVSQNKPLGSTKASLVKDGSVYFGARFADSNAMNSVEMLGRYKKMSKTDTLNTKFYGQVTEVCKVKGCWMKLQLGNGDESMVKFKDYGFFVTQDLVGKEVIVNGLAFIEEMSVEDQRHFAKDAGKLDEEITQITELKKKYAFQADGVLIKK